jgi:hypothetical protein
MPPNSKIESPVCGEPNYVVASKSPLNRSFGLKLEQSAEAGDPSSAGALELARLWQSA